MSVPTRAGMPGPHRAMVGGRAGRPCTRPTGGCATPARSRKEMCPFTMNLVAGSLAWASWHVVGSTRPPPVADGVDPAGMRQRPPVLGAERPLQAHRSEVLARALAEQHLPGAAWLLTSFSPLLALLPVRRMITVVKENRPKQWVGGVQAPNEQPSPFPLSPPFSAPPCPPFCPVLGLLLFPPLPAISIPAGPCWGRPSSVRGGHWASGTPGPWMGSLAYPLFSTRRSHGNQPSCYLGSGDVVVYLLGPEDHLFQPCGPQDVHTGPSRPGLPQAALIWAATKQESIYRAPSLCRSRAAVCPRVTALHVCRSHGGCYYPHFIPEGGGGGIGVQRGYTTLLKPHS